MAFETTLQVALPVDDGVQTGSSDSRRDAYLIGKRLEVLCRASCPFAREASFS